MGRIWHSEILKPAACVALAFSVLILPLRWILAWVIAVAVHECCHLASVRLCGGRITQIRFSALGANIMAEGLSPGKELLCVLAGPIGALLLLPMAKWFPAAAVCAVFQSVYNLLPLKQLDGGMALRTGAGLLFSPETADTISTVAQWICLALISAGALYASLWLKLGMMPLILAIWLIIKTNFGKIPCKPRRQAVQ